MLPYGTGIQCIVFMIVHKSIYVLTPLYRMGKKQCICCHSHTRPPSDSNSVHTKVATPGLIFMVAEFFVQRRVTTKEKST